jgi:hypothetical protein
MALIIPATPTKRADKMISGTINVGEPLTLTPGAWQSSTPYRPGDRVIFSGDTNRMRRKISKVTSATAFECIERIRPSRGYARHIRRKKTQERR